MNTQTAIAPAPMSTTGARLSGRLILLLSLTVVLPAAPYLFGLEGYIVNIVMQAVTYGIAVVGMTIVLGYTGQINLAQGVFFGLGAYVVALGTMDYGLGFWPMLLLGIAIAALAGIVIGLTTLRLSGHYLAMITISCQQIFDLVLVNWVPVTHGPDGISGIARPSIFGFQLTDDKAYLGLCITVLYLAILLVWWLPETRLGRAMQAVRENQLAAEVTGVKTLAVKVTAFTMCAGLAGIGGALYAAGFSYISPDNFNFKMSIELLTMALLGGAQSPIGSTIGTVLLIMLPEWLRFLKEIYMAGYGLAVILIMVFMPEGIWGIIKSAGGRLHRVRPNAEKYTSMLAPLTLDLPRFDPTPMLELDRLQKHFGGVKAVDGVSIRVARGQIHALIGPNGSGKTTTLNVLNGIYRPTGGRILVDGVDITNKAPNERAAHGVGRTFQNIRLFPSMTVLENVMIGAQRRNNPIAAGEAALRDRALSALSFVDMLDKADAIVKNLPYGHQRLVEIARALAGHPKLLLLDEPAAGLNQTEKGNLVGLLKRLRTQGITIFLIEHDMHLIEQVSDTISVLNFGRKIAEGTPQEVLRHPDVIAAYLGKDAHAAAA
jgi:branched-chain amino acid transport system permease protein